MDEKEIKDPELVQEGTEEQKPKGRNALRARYKEKYPDTNWDEQDDDALADKAMSEYDEISGKMADRDATDKKMADLFDKNPQSASFLMGMARGEDFLVNLQKNFGEDIVAAMSDPAKLDELAKANKEYQDKVANNKKLQDEWDNNAEKSLELLSKKQEELGLTDEEVATCMDVYKKCVDDWNSGNFSEATLDIFMKANKYDADVASAKRQGEVNGRNANIEEKLRKSRNTSDGMPNIGGQSNNGARGKSFRQGAGMGQGSIWERGNLKRNNYE